MMINYNEELMNAMIDDIASFTIDLINKICNVIVECYNEGLITDDSCFLLREED